MPNHFCCIPDIGFALSVPGKIVRFLCFGAVRRGYMSTILRWSNLAP